MHVSLLATLSAVTFVSACTLADAVEVESSFQEVEGFNGENLNGENLNGENLNGENLNGENLNGPNPGTFTIWTSLENVVLGETTLASTTLSATVFTGDRNGTTLTGSELTGAEFQAMRGDGRMVTLRIASIVPAPTGTTKWRYYVDYLETDGQWYSICHNSSGPLAAIPLDGTWDHRRGVAGGGSHTDDPTRFTFACEKTGSLAKCVDNGYEPWVIRDGVSLARHHQACVRMLRADYCGNGTSYTTNGRLLNVYDGIGIQQDTNPWKLEAEWDQDGARCMTENLRTSAAVPCYDPELHAACGMLEHFGTGTLIMNEIP